MSQKSQQRQQNVSRLSQGHGKSPSQNRKCVVVGQKMVKTEVEEKIEKESMSSAVSKSSSLDSKDTIKLPSCSPSGSLRSSNSSFLGGSFDEFDISMSSMELDVFEELKSEIEATAEQFKQLQSEISEIPILRGKVLDVEAENRRLADELSEKCGIVETMKQRLSVLHEQNSQLAHLTKHSHDTSETTLRMRNALVASLAQLKKLQGNVDEIPSLKAEITSLQKQNVALKEQEHEVLQRITGEGVTLTDYKSILDGNKRLQASGETEMLQIVERVDLLSSSIEGLKEQISNFGNFVSNSSSPYVKKLEREKEELYKEIIELKLSKSISHSMDTVCLNNECMTLRKENSLLQSKLENLAIQYKKEKERIILKLFQIEVSNLKSQKMGISKRLSALNSSGNASLTSQDESNDLNQSIAPQFKSQLLRLHQFQLQREQCNYIMQLAMSDKEELEKTLSDRNAILKEKSIQQLEQESRGYENKLAIAYSKIHDLERRLSRFSQTDSDDSLPQLSSLYIEKKDSVELSELKKKLSEEQHLHEASAQKCKKYKEQKLKLESKIKESKGRYQSLASELTNAVQLMRSYQDQCIKFEKELDIMKMERDSFRSEIVSLKAELEVLHAEHDSMSKSLVKEEDVELAQKQIKDKTLELECLEEKFEKVTNQLASLEKCLANEQILSAKLQNEVKQLEEEKEVEIEKRISELDRNKAVLEEMTVQTDELQTRLNTSEEQCHALNQQLTQQLYEIENNKIENSKLLAALSDKDKCISALTEDLESKTTVSSSPSPSTRQLYDEIEGYKAMIKSLRKQIDEVETSEIERENLQRKIRAFEASLRDSPHDNQALIDLLHQTVGEVPSYSVFEQSLRRHNAQLEEQISLLSQWNDKQRKEIEDLELMLEESSHGYQVLSEEIRAKDSLSEENLQLKHELKEVEMEVNTLRRQVRADVQEELQLKLEAKTQLLAVFNQHNTMLQRQVEDLQAQVKFLGGKLDRERAVSPPPMPDITTTLCSHDSEGHVPRSVSALDKENILLKQRITLMETEFDGLHCMSASIRRCGSTLHVLSSISIETINEEVLVSVPHEMLVPCSLLSDHLKLHASVDDSIAQKWIDAIRTEWFACVSQKSLTPACAQSYISTISRLSHKLLDVVINLQDQKGNTALHHSAANGNLPVLNQFVTLQSCDATITNHAGYNALMILSSCLVEVDSTVHQEALDTLIERSGLNIASKKDQQTALMLAACSGKLPFVHYFIQKGCDVNLKDKDGSTALMYAVQRGHESIVRALVSSPNCDLLAKDNDGQTAKDIAKTYNSHVLSLLKNSVPSKK